MLRFCKVPNYFPVIEVLLVSICCFLCVLTGQLSAAQAYQAPSQTSLRFVHALWRHGDRTPVFKTFPTDHNQLWTWPEGWGELTKQGIREQYKLGSYLRHRYVDTGFLSKDYNYSEIYARSTDFNRTIMSALANLAGMYPPMVGNNWKEGMTWQPIPVHVIARMDDPTLWPERPCPAAKDIFNEVMRSEAVKKVENDNALFLNFLRNVTGLKLDVLYDTRFVYDPLFVESLYSRQHTWPSWVTKDVFDRITYLFQLSTRFYAHDIRLQRLKGGLLLGEIATRFANKAKNSPLIQPPTLKYYAYSAHDTTLIAQLENLGAYDGYMPVYSSVILYELHEKVPGRFTVEVWYVKDQGATPPLRITVQGCGGDICDLDAFVNLAKNHTPSDWYMECGLSNKDPSP